VLASRRDAKNSLMPSWATGEICLIEYFDRERELLELKQKEYHNIKKRLIELKSVDVHTNCKLFVNQELFDILTKALRKIVAYPEFFELLPLFDRPNEFKGFTREDLFKLLEAALDTLAKSIEKEDIASATVKLSDGRKLHVIVPAKSGVRSRFQDTILLISNLEIEATTMGRFAAMRRFENNEYAVEKVARIRDEDIAKLDEETQIAILELLFQRALLSSI